MSLLQRAILKLLHYIFFGAIFIANCIKLFPKIWKKLFALIGRLLKGNDNDSLWSSIGYIGEPPKHMAILINEDISFPDIKKLLHLFAKLQIPNVSLCDKNDSLLDNRDLILNIISDIEKKERISLDLNKNFIKGRKCNGKNVDETFKISLVPKHDGRKSIVNVV